MHVRASIDLGDSAEGRSEKLCPKETPRTPVTQNGI
jgi:hypothetical protein